MHGDDGDGGFAVCFAGDLLEGGDFAAGSAGVSPSPPFVAFGFFCGAILCYANCFMRTYYDNNEAAVPESLQPRYLKVLCTSWIINAEPLV
jgi:hypothetical protein